MGLVPLKDDLLTLCSLFSCLDPKSITTLTDTTTDSTQATTKDAQSNQVSKVSLEKKPVAVLTHTDFHSKLWTVTEPVAVPGLTTLSFLTAAVTVKSKPTVKLNFLKVIKFLCSMFVVSPCL